MCGRYVVTRSWDDLLAEFEAADLLGGLQYQPDYNVAPTDPVPVVLTRHPPGDRSGPVSRQLRVARWGLVPSFAPDTGGAARRINARAETAARLPSFRAALARRRCLIPADGWYEWARTDDGGRQPYYLTAADGSLLAFAGLYEIWGAAEDRLLTCAIVTTAAVGELVRVHDRMPLVLPRQAWSGWLDRARPDPGPLLAPPAPGLVAGLELRPVGPAVGNVASDGPQLIAPVPATAPAAPPLF
jgi:putative SOS response-associated peptidase YedK